MLSKIEWWEVIATYNESIFVQNYLENKGVNYKDITFINYHIKEIYSF